MRPERPPRSLRARSSTRLPTWSTPWRTTPRRQARLAEEPRVRRQPVAQRVLAVERRLAARLVAGQVEQRPAGVQGLVDALELERQLVAVQVERLVEVQELEARLVAAQVEQRPVEVQELEARLVAALVERRPAEVPELEPRLAAVQVERRPAEVPELEARLVAAQAEQRLVGVLVALPLVPRAPPSIRSPAEPRRSSTRSAEVRKPRAPPEPTRRFERSAPPRRP